jgi:hypothetical protein
MVRLVHHYQSNTFTPLAEGVMSADYRVHTSHYAGGLRFVPASFGFSHVLLDCQFDHAVRGGDRVAYLVTGDRLADL